MLLETLLGAGAKEAGAILAKYILESWKDGLFSAWTLEKAQRAAISYSQRFADAHGQIKVLGMHEPVPVRDVYTSVRVLENTLPYSSRDELERALRRDRRRTLSRDREVSRPGIDVANDRQFLNVMGGPGAGKSTFLRRIGLEALLHRRDGLASILPQSDRPYRHKLLPVFIELKIVKFKTVNLLSLIQEEFVACGFPDSFAEKALKKGRLLILLDGLDEVPIDKLDKTIDHIRSFVDRFDKNRYISSCRTAFYKAYFTRFTDVVLTDFNDKQVANFIENWFRSEEDLEQKTAQRFLNTLNRPDNAATLDLARTPLLLTFLCLVQDDRQNLPSTRSSLYKYALEILLEKWAAHKRIHQEPIYTDKLTNASLKTDLEIVMLSNIAGNAFSKDKLFFTADELVLQISEFLQETLNAPKHLDGRQVLNDIEVRQGLLVQRAHDIYSFSHLTLQEYLAACFHSQPKRMPKAIKKHLFSPRWREVFLLMAGMSSVDSEELVSQMNDQILEFGANYEIIQTLVGWTRSVVGVRDGDDASIGWRAAALFFLVIVKLTLARDAARDLWRTGAKDMLVIAQLEEARNIARNLSLVRDLASELAVAMAPDLAKIINLAMERDLDRARDLKSDDAADGNIRLGLALTGRAKKASLVQRQKDTSTSAALPERIGSDSAEQRKSGDGDALEVEHVYSLLDGERELDLVVAKQHLSDLEKLGCASVDFNTIGESVRGLRVPPRKALWLERLNYSNGVAEIILKGLGIMRLSRVWSAEEVHALTNYLYANVMLVKCRDAALNLPAAAWAKIQETMFRMRVG